MSKTILLVDGDPDSQLIYTSMLEHTGYHVVEATDAAEALRLAHEQQPDLILTELFLSGMDAFELLRRLHGEAETAGIPIMVLNSRGLPDDEERARAEGVVEYFLKPFEPRTLVRRVDALLRPPEP